MGNNIKNFIRLAFIVVLTTTTGCKVKSTLEIKPAPIHQVEIRFAESSPVQVFVYVQGGLSDGCTTLKDIKTTRQDTIIDIAVTVQRPLGQICTTIYGYFEQNVALGTDFISGNTYHLKVNDVARNFVMP